MALALRVVGGYNDVIDKQGLSVKERHKRADEMYALCVAVLHDTLYTAKGPPGRLFGMPTRLWFAFAGNICSRRVYCRCFPDRPFKERFASQYFVEGFFSQLVAILGYKPCGWMAVAFMDRVERLAQIQADLTRTFSFPPSPAEHYPHSRNAMEADGTAIIEELLHNAELLTSGMDSTVRGEQSMAKLDALLHRNMTTWSSGRFDHEHGSGPGAHGGNRKQVSETVADQKGTPIRVQHKTYEG